MPGLVELETELVIGFSTGSVVTYRYKRIEAGLVTITRTLKTPEGATNTVPISIDDLRMDAGRLIAVASHFTRRLTCPRCRNPRSKSAA